MPEQTAIASELTDCFALLGQPRRPWLDPDSVKQSFLALSAPTHPDRIHASSESDRQAAGRHFSGLNAAYQCLREPKDRLRHLLELGTKPKDIDRVPSDRMGVFFEMGSLLKQTDAFIAEMSAAASPVVKAQLFERGLDWTDKLQSTQCTLNTRRDELAAELKEMNTAWEAADQSASSRDRLPLARLEEIYRELGFLGRWSAQLQERIVQLSL